MRVLVIGSIALFLTGCASSSHSIVASSSYDDTHPSSAWELQEAAREVRDRVVYACTGLDPKETLLSLSTSISSYPGNPETCYRDRLALAFNDSDGTKNCAAESALSNFIVCLGFGSFLNVIRHNAGSPKSLSAEEWRNNAVAIENTVNEVAIQALVQCATKAQTAACQQEVAIASFGLPQSEVRFCRGSNLYRCLADKALARFMQDRAIATW